MDGWFSLGFWTPALFPAAALLLALAVTLSIRGVLVKRLRPWAATSQGFSAALAQAIDTPSLLWCAIVSIHVATQVAGLSDRLALLAGRTLTGLWIASATLALSKAATLAVRQYGSRVEGAQSVTTLSQNLARLLVIAFGLMVLLSELGIAVTPILTALGVGGLAVALALQDTLSNLFAGFYITLAGQVRVGDYIKIDSGEEGFVIDITWRAAVLRMLQNNLVIIPNAKLARATVTNYHLPERRMALMIPVSVSYDCDPENIERILLEETKAAVGEVDGLLADPPPLVRFIPGFGAYSLDFTLICQVAEFTDQFLVQHELRKRIFRRFREEKIEIPFPVQTLNLRRA